MQEIITDTTITKWCSVCQKDKSLEEFYNMKRGGYGKDPICKICRNRTSKRWYRKNKKRKKAANRAWYKANKIDQKEKMKKWYQNNKEQHQKYMKEWKKNNPEKVKRIWRRYKEKKKREGKKQ